MSNNTVRRDQRQRTAELQPDYTADQVCALLQISRRTLSKMQSEGSIEFYRIGRAVRFKAEHIETFRNAAPKAWPPVRRKGVAA